MPLFVRGCAHPRGMPDDWYKGIKYLKEKEMLEKVLNIPGIDSFDEHDYDLSTIGNVIGAWVDENGQLNVDIEVLEKHPEYERIKEALLSGAYKGLSLGRKHVLNAGTGELINTNIFEVSPCEEGALPGTYIETVTVASKGKEKGGLGIYGTPPSVNLTDLRVETSPFKHWPSLQNQGQLNTVFSKMSTPTFGGPSASSATPEEMLRKMADPLLGLQQNAMNSFSAGMGAPAGAGSMPAGAAQGAGTGSVPALTPSAAPTGSMPPPSRGSDPAGTDLAASLRASQERASHEQAALQAARDSAAAAASPAAAAAQEAPAPTKDPSIQNVTISKEKYDQLLDLQPSMAAKMKELEDLQSEVEEWRGLRTLTGATKASEIAARVASARTREVQEFKGLVDEALPEIERIYRSSDVPQQAYMKTYLESCRAYADHPGKVSLEEMNNARGFIGMICGSVRSKNTEVTEKDAAVRALQARCSAAEQRADEATKQLTIVTTASARRKTIQPFNPSEYGLPPVEAPYSSGQETPTLSSQYAAPPTSTYAGESSATGKRASPFASPLASQSMFADPTPKKHRVYHPEKGMIDIEASGFHLKPEEQFINYFAPEHREEVMERAAPAIAMFDALRSSHSNYCASTPMEKHFLPLGEKEVDLVQPLAGVGSVTFEKGTRRMYG